MVSRVERESGEKISKEFRPFVIDLKNLSKFSPQEFDTFAQAQQDHRYPNNNIVLCWIATEYKIFIFPKEIGHVKAYRILERVKGRVVKSAGYLTLTRKWDGAFSRHLHGYAESLNLVLAPTRSEEFRDTVIKPQLKAKLNDHFTFYPPPAPPRPPPAPP